MKKIIIASTSKSRFKILSDAGVEIYKTVESKFDESDFKEKNNNLSPKNLALKLAEKKGLKVFCNLEKNDKNNIIISGDQVLEMGGKAFDKPGTAEKVKLRISNLSNKSHFLHSAITVIINGKIVYSHIESAEMTVRELSAEFINEYCDLCAEKTKNSVGGYHFEGLGAQLFTEIKGDYFTILGLPLIPLLKFLREQKIILK